MDWRRLRPGRARLDIDGESDVREANCDSCGRTFSTVTSFVTRDSSAFCVAKTALHDHDGHEAWMDVVFGTFDEASADHVTFGCRVGPVPGSRGPAATAVDAARPYADSPFWGTKLSRDEALADPRVRDFWRVVDHLLLHEPAITHHVYHR